MESGLEYFTHVWQTRTDRGVCLPKFYLVTPLPYHLALISPSQGHFGVDFSYSSTSSSVAGWAWSSTCPQSTLYLTCSEIDSLLFKIVRVVYKRKRKRGTLEENFRKATCQCSKIFIRLSPNLITWSSESVAIWADHHNNGPHIQSHSLDDDVLLWWDKLSDV